MCNCYNCRNGLGHGGGRIREYSPTDPNKRLPISKRWGRK